MSGRSALAIGGAIIGAYFGQPGLGFALGSALGAVAFPPSTPDISSSDIQPRLQDSAITGASIGSPLTLGFGTVRLAGQIIWATPLLEESTTTVSMSSAGGGKGGGGGNNTQTTVRRKYFRSFAVSFGEGPAEEVLKLWFDGNLVMDRSGTEDDVLVDGIVYRFYPGSGTQLPDPLIQADKGADRTPAFRGTTYIVFDNLPVSDFRIPLPNVTAEIAFIAEPARLHKRVVVAGGSPFDAYQADSLTVDWLRHRVLVRGSGAGGAIGLRRFDLRTLTEEYWITDQEALDQETPPITFSGDAMYYMPDGTVVTNLGLGNARPIVRLHAETLKEISRFGASGGSLQMSPESWVSIKQFFHISFIGMLGRADFMVGIGLFPSMGVLALQPPGSLTWIWDSDTNVTDLGDHTTIMTGCPGLVGEQFGEGYVFAGPTQFGVKTSGEWDLYKITIIPRIILPMFGGDPYETGIVEIQKIKTFEVTDFVPGVATVQSVTSLMYDQIDNTLIFHMRPNNNLESYVIKYDPENDAVLWTTFVPGTPNESDSANLVGGTYGFFNFNNGFVLNTATGDLLFDNEEPDWSVNRFIGVGLWDPENESYLTSVTGNPALTKIYFNRSAGGGLDLATIVQRTCLRCGIPLARIDVTDITDIIVDGSFLSRQLNGASFLSQILRYYQIDVIDHNFMLRFQKRGNTPVATFDDTDFVPNNQDQGQQVVTGIIPDPELPESLSVTFINAAIDYQQDTRVAKRIRNPTPSTSSRNLVDLSIAAVLGPEEVKQQAEKLLYSAWNESATFNLQTHWGHLDLECGDVVNLALDALSARARITTAGVGADLVYELALLGEEPTQYTSIAQAGANEGFTQQRVPRSLPVRLFLFDIPLLRNGDEVVNRAGAPAYYAISSFRDADFRNATFYKSDQGTNFDALSTILMPATWGTTTSALGDPLDVFQTDNINTLTLNMTVGTSQMASVSQLDILNGQNTAVLLKTNGEAEILQFRDVLQNADGTLTLSGFIRGARGTDTMAYGHTANELFVVISPPTGGMFALGLDEIGSARFYKALGAGQNFDLTPTESLTSTGRSLKPYKPVQERATLSGNDVILTWERRSRVGAGIQDDVDTVILGEAAEAYEIDIFDGPGGNLVRTVTGLSSPTYTYTEAEQTADGFTPPLSALTLLVYQISAEVGRGFSREVQVQVAS